MTENANWRPDVPSSQLFAERTWLQGSILSAVAYGINLTLFTLNVMLLIGKRNADAEQDQSVKPRNKTKGYLLLYVVVMFVLSTLAMASQAKLTELGYVDNRNFPGGPSEYVDEMFSIPISRMGSICFSVMNWLSDCLLLWRCFVIYRTGSRSIWLVMFVPFSTLIACIVAGSYVLSWVSRPSISPWDVKIPTVIYGIIIISLNIMLTSMIAIRLYLHQRALRRVLGPRHMSNYVLSVIAMLVESAFLSDVFFIFFLIPFIMRNQVANVPLGIMVQTQTTASFLIIFRVAQGTAWRERSVGETERASKQFSMIRFVEPSTQTTLAPLDSQPDNLSRPDPETFKTSWTLTEITDRNDSV
ncbi:hypothetical protein BJ165DRAFT_1357057 [Panaeolus papilionaceus]|nr:hypothetical protein BJ165DRAFT_1357057 [Panaeolus papilionaceus]